MGRSSFRSFAVDWICIKEIWTFFYEFEVRKQKHEACQGFASWLDRAASCFCALDTPEACKTQSASYFAVAPQNASSIIAFSDEAAPFHSAMKHCSVSLHNMKHSACAPYDLSSIALCATDDEKMKEWEFTPGERANPHKISQNSPL